jgi:chemotaxis protein CheC
MTKSLTADQLDALQEFMNIGVGRAANLLNEMLDCRIILEVPVIEILMEAELRQQMLQRFDQGTFSAVQMGFSSQFSGVAELLFPTESASTLVSLLTGEDLNSPDLDAVKIGTLNEVGNILLNGVMGAMSNLLGQHLRYNIPLYLEDTIENILMHDSNVSTNTVFLLAQTRFTVKQLEIIGDIILIFEVMSFDTLVAAINQQIGISVS